MMRTNPTDAIDVSFSTYLQGRKSKTESHMEGGVPDYAYSADYAMQQKIRAIPGFYALAKAITNTVVPRKIKELNMNGLKVGPNQFPEVYQMYADCARILGIGIPTVYIEPNPSEINASAYATEDNAPLSVITSALLERLTPGELRTVVGHECGHIHNNHVIYTIAANLILNYAGLTLGSAGAVLGSVAKTVANTALSLASYPLQLALQAWSRASEVTADRAGVICANDMDDAVKVQAKFMYGAAFNHSDVNLDSIHEQYDMLRSTPVRFLELGSTHPMSVRRMLAMKEFMNSEVLYRWRPEWKTPGMQLFDKMELDARCQKYIGVVKSNKRGQA